MTNLLLRELRARGIVLDGVVPFVRGELVATMTEHHPKHIVMQVPEGVRPGPYWLVTRADGERMVAAGFTIANDFEIVSSAHADG